MATRTRIVLPAAAPARDVRAISRVLADPRRYQILQHIAASPRMACSDLRTEFPITAATLSHHLRELESAGLIETARRGKFIDISFRRDVWQSYLAALGKL